MSWGADVSEHQGVLGPDWFAGFDFVIVRAYNEHDNPDWAFPANWANAAGRTRRGAYGWAIPDADNFTYGRMLVSKAPDAELGWWVDVERSSRGLAGPGDVEAYLAGIESMGGWGGFYSNIGELHRTPTLDAHPWWMADYGPNDGRYHDPNEQAPRPPEGRPWVIHQFTSRGGPGGSGLDLNFAPTLDFAGGAAMPDDDVGLDLETIAWIKTQVAGLDLAGNTVTNRHVIDAVLRIERAVTALAAPVPPPAGGTVDLDALAELLLDKILDRAAHLRTH